MNRNSVRIIGGAWRGRRIEFPELPGLRPTPDRVRETLFNWLQFDVAHSTCLDLFAGSGALGFEALSRGAVRVVWVEKSPVAADHIAMQRARLMTAGEARARTQIVTRDAEQWLSGLVAADDPPFDLVFLDPPFDQDLLVRLLPVIAAKNLVKPDGWVYLECERASGVPVLPAGWTLAQSKSAGEVGYHLAGVTGRPRS